MSRYDAILGIIPLTFMIALLAATVGSVRLETAIIGGSLIGVLVVIDALFLNPPSVSTARTRGE